MAKHPSLTENSKGEIAKNLRVISGVLPNGENYGNWGEVEQDAGITVNTNSISWVTNGSAQAIRNYKVENIKANTKYTLKINILNTTLANTETFQVSSSGISQTNEAFSNIDTTGQRAVTFTTDATITEDYIRLVCLDTNFPSDFQIEVVKLYETSLGDNSNDQPTVENSITPQYTIPRWYQSDTNNLLFETDGTPKVVPVADLVDNQNNQWFVNHSAGFVQDLFFENPISGECEEKALKYLGFNLSVLIQDSEGFYLIDADGEYLESEE